MAIVLLFGLAHQSHAIYDPLSKPNNYHGIHILFPAELEDAAKLVNSTGGEWGYVIIPIQAGERDLEKWQKFMDQAHALKVIPIIRLSTEANYANTATWRKPDEYDLVDFANFLNSLSWPTKNRYIVLFNEINRYDEWSGEPPDPHYYANLTATAHDIFKSRNQDFFLILGGFDNASVTDGVKYMNGFDFLASMYTFRSDIFEKIDGFSSHSYPNPGFAAAPSTTKRMGVATYRYEYDYINARASSKKAAFITETGWDDTVVTSTVISDYYIHTFDQIWGADKDKIVAVTPFLLHASGPFEKFSFIKNGQPKLYYTAILGINKTRGQPEILPVAQKPQSEVGGSISKTFNPDIELSIKPEINPYLKSYLKSLLGISEVVVK